MNLLHYVKAQSSNFNELYLVYSSICQELMLVNFHFIDSIELPYKVNMEIIKWKKRKDEERERGEGEV